MAPCSQIFKQSYVVLKKNFLISFRTKEILKILIAPLICAALSVLASKFYFKLIKFIHYLKILILENTKGNQVPTQTVMV